MLRMKDLNIFEGRVSLNTPPRGKLLINTINAHSYNTALKDAAFAEALIKGDVLPPDGASIVMACRPKQEKWTYQYWKDLMVNCHVGNIDAVFDFFAGTVEHALLWWQEHSLKWLYRLIKEPKRMW